MEDLGGRDAVGVGHADGRAAVDERAALRYAGVANDGIAGLAPAPKMNLVLSGAQVDAAMGDIAELRKAVREIPGGEKREAAEQRLRALELAFAKRTL